MQALFSCAHKFVIGMYFLAVFFLCAIAFPGATAWGVEAITINNDITTGIYSNADDFISYRYMRHIWVTTYSVMAAAVQKGGYEGYGLVLYKTMDEGLHWTLEAPISSDVDIVSDGIIDTNNNILLVTSLLSENRTVDVNFIRMRYDSISQSWTMNPLTPVTIFNSGAQYRGTRASLALDSNGIIWCAFRLENTQTGIFQIRVYYSTDDGSTWTDSNNSFGTLNNLAEKCAKIIAVDSRIAMIYQDMKWNGSIQERYKLWAYREDTQSLQDIWTSNPIAKMTDTTGDPYSSHWSVAADDFGNMHLSYEDNGIHYLKYDAVGKTWVGPKRATNYGNYSSISVAANNDLYLFAKNQPGLKIILRRYSAASHTWDPWVEVSSNNYSGTLRMSSPERFVGHLPLLYQVGSNSPYQLIYNLLDTVL